MTEAKLTTTARILIEAQSLIQDRKNWWDGRNMSSTSGYICATMAVAHATRRRRPNTVFQHDECLEAQDRLHEAAREMGYRNAVELNYAGHKRVMDMYRAAIQNELLAQVQAS